MAYDKAGTGEAIRGIQETFHTLVTGLIEMNHKRRAQFPDFKREMGRVSYAKEFCSVFCDVGRQTGKTEYVRRNARSQDIIVVRDERTKRNAYGHGRVTQAQVLVAEQMVTRAGIGLVPGIRDQIVYIDEPGQVLQKCTIWNIYSALVLFESCGIKQTFVFLGDPY